MDQESWYAVLFLVFILFLSANAVGNSQPGAPVIIEGPGQEYPVQATLPAEIVCPALGGEMVSFRDRMQYDPEADPREGYARCSTGERTSCKGENLVRSSSIGRAAGSEPAGSWFDPRLRIQGVTMLTEEDVRSIARTRATVMPSGTDDRHIELAKFAVRLLEHIEVLQKERKDLEDAWRNTMRDEETAR